MRRIDAFQESACFLGGHDRGCALYNRVARPAHGMRRIPGDDLARYQPVKEHANAGEMLLDGRSFAHLAQLLDIGRHMHRLHVLDARDASALGPAQERAGRLPIRRPSVSVADLDGEEFQKAPSGIFTGLRDERRKPWPGGSIGDDFSYHNLPQVQRVTFGSAAFVLTSSGQSDSAEI